MDTSGMNVLLISKQKRLPARNDASRSSVMRHCAVGNRIVNALRCFVRKNSLAFVFSRLFSSTNLNVRYILSVLLTYEHYCISYPIF